MAEEGDIDAPFMNETFQFFTRLGTPAEIKSSIIQTINSSRFSASYKRCLKHTVETIFDKVVQYSNQKSLILPELEIEMMLLECRIAANSRDIKQRGITAIEHSIIFAAKMVLTRTIGEDRERKLQRYPGYVEQRAVNTEMPQEEVKEIETPKRRFGIFRW